MGSEMCIRDRYLARPASQAGWSPQLGLQRNRFLPRACFPAGNDGILPRFTLILFAVLSVVFHAPKPPATVHPKCRVPMEYMHTDDELVYPLNVRQSFPLQHLRFMHAVPGRKCLKFDMFLRCVPCVGIVDSDATHSFVSREFARSTAEVLPGCHRQRCWPMV